MGIKNFEFQEIDVKYLKKNLFICIITESRKLFIRIYIFIRIYMLCKCIDVSIILYLGKGCNLAIRLEDDICIHNPESD